MANRHQQSTQQTPRRTGKAIPFRVLNSLPRAPEPPEGQSRFDFVSAEKKEEGKNE